MPSSRRTDNRYHKSLKKTNRRYSIVNVSFACFETTVYADMRREEKEIHLARWNAEIKSWVFECQPGKSWFGRMLPLEGKFGLWYPSCKVCEAVYILLVIDGRSNQ